jgi:hypothetical protein
VTRKKKKRKKNPAPQTPLPKQHCNTAKNDWTAKLIVFILAVAKIKTIYSIGFFLGVITKKNKKNNSCCYLKKYEAKNWGF